MVLCLCCYVCWFPCVVLVLERGGSVRAHIGIKSTLKIARKTSRVFCYMSGLTLWSPGPVVGFTIGTFLVNARRYTKHVPAHSTSIDRPANNLISELLIRPPFNADT